ncbi:MULTISPECIES: glycine zipper domain-containing protein [Salinibaculum]|uniref:glycine zipper domain-containing protein n=1 Tax=Salinibaculum TaxID=2732368 RepID=UPI0030CC95B9
MGSRIKRIWNRSKYAAIGAAIGAALGGLISRNAASTGGGLGALVGATVGEKRVDVGNLVEKVNQRTAES